VRHLLSLLLLASLPLAAQQGDRKGHDNMSPVVPEDLIPPAPVLSPEEALERFELADGFIIEPVATEPLVEKPACLDFDAAGRMWVCEMSGYMPDIDGAGEDRPTGKVVVLEDRNGDGEVDHRHVFLDEVLLPRAISVWEDGVLLLDQMRLFWVPRDGLEATGEPQVIDAKFALGGNVEHKPNGLRYHLDNWLYLAKSDRRIRRDGDDWTIEPTAFRGQWGIARDDFGILYHNHNSNVLSADLVAPNLLWNNPGADFKHDESRSLVDSTVWPIRVTPGLNRAYISKSNGYDSNTLDPESHKLLSATGAAGLTIYRGTNFPEFWRDTAFITESSVQLLKACPLEREDGQPSARHATPGREFLASTDERFRPVNVYNAPDGSLYLLDLYHGIIQHKTYMTSYLREQILSRGLDQPGYGHGRIYRIRHRDGELQPAVDLAALDAPQLVATLAHPNAWHRETAQRLLVQRRDPAALKPLAALAADGNPHARVHAIWTLEGLEALAPDHLRPALRDGGPRVRAAALWAAVQLDHSGLTALVPELLELAADEILAAEPVPYLARALAQSAHPNALAALGPLLDRSQAPFLREAIVSGADGHEQAVKTVLGSDDPQLVAWLDQGARGPGAETKPDLDEEALASWERGKAIYLGEAACFSCHGPNGRGVVNLGPPLDGSEWVTGDPDRLGKIFLHGMIGPVEVAGKVYNPPAAMPGLSFNPLMTDAKLADIATYVRNAWDNRAEPVDETFFAELRQATAERAGRPYTAAELNADTPTGGDQ